jgi:hypothetical protein
MPYLSTRPSFSLTPSSLSLVSSMGPAAVLPTATPPATLAAPAHAAAPSHAPTTAAQSNAWTSHVRQVYADLKAADAGTTYKQALTHARASYKRAH